MDQNQQYQDYPQQQQPQLNQPLYLVPAHSNKMGLSVICTILGALICGIFTTICGIIAIIYSSKSNGLYRSALLAQDDSLKQNLYMQSEANNKTAQIWLIIGFIVGILCIILLAFLVATGALDEII